jgi:predicted small secreted protein
MKKIGIALASLILLSTVLAGCGSSGVSSDQQAEKAKKMDDIAHKDPNYANHVRG